MRRTLPVSLILVCAVFTAHGAFCQQYFSDESIARLPNRSDASNRVLFVDVDTDGDPDILVSNTGFPGSLDRLFTNDGQGFFQDETGERLPFLVDQTSMVAAGDLDGDADPDLFVSNVAGENRLLVNDGTGVFADETAARLPGGEGTRIAFLGDLDTDGDLDALAAGYGPARLLLNDGRGFFADGTGGRLPAIDPDARAGLLEDTDADGDLDLVIGFELPPGIVLENDGEGVFTVTGSLPAPYDTMRTRGIACGDVDRDGDFDLVTANFTRGFFGDRLLFAGAAGFTDMSDSLLPELPVTRDEGTCPLVADFDADGILDIFVAKYEQSIYLVGSTSGEFLDATAERLPADVTTISTWADLGDVDGDGDPDLVISNLLQRTNLYLNHSQPDTVAPYLRVVLWPPELVEPDVSQEVRLHARDDALGISSVRLAYSAAGQEFEEIPCVHAGGSLYLGQIPGEEEGVLVRYYARAVDGRGNSSVDPRGAPDSTYSYVVRGGTGVGEEEGKSAPGAVALLQNHPNPFNPRTAVTFTVAEIGSRGNAGALSMVHLAVFDARGRKVKVLFEGALPAGRHRMVWDGRDSRGAGVAGGTYFLRLEVGGKVLTRKAVLLE